MIYSFIPPARLEGTIQLSASKSISNRALILYALSHGTIEPRNLSDCDDTCVMLKALTGKSEEIDIMAAGTAMRFLTAYLSTLSQTHTITGTERMKQRPISILVNALRELGADISYLEKEGFPPLRISGKPLPGGNITLNGGVSSQFISALLMIGPVMHYGLRLQLTGEIISRPYIDLTLKLMHDYGAEAAWVAHDTIAVTPKRYEKEVDFCVESDWSAASYWYELAALAPEADVTLKGLFHHSYQGDSRGARLFAKLGVDSKYHGGDVMLSKSSTYTDRLEEDFSDIPDLAQTFVVTCALLNIPFRFTGLQTLKIKETDRINALKCELRKLGYVLKDEKNSILSWDGERCEPEEAPVIQTYEDHRMAMAFAPAVYRFPNLRIAEPQVVSKSYPSFWNHLKQVEFSIENIY